MIILHEFHHPIQSSYIGVVISSFSAAGLIAAPIFGKATDKLQKSRIPALVGISFSIAGNILYCCVRDQYWIAVARFISGIGFSLDGAFLGTLGRSVSLKTKSKTIALMLLVRQAGMVVGPAGIILLQKINFKIGFVTVDKYSSAGLVLAVCWKRFHGH